MIDSDTQSRLLQLYPVLRRLTPPQLNDALASAKVIRAAADSVMFDEDQPCRSFPLLLSGRIRVIKAAANGRELQLYRVNPGEICIIAMGCLTGQAHYHARAVAQEDIELIALRPEAFKMLFSQSESFRDYIFSTFSDHLVDLTQLVSAVTFQKLDQRLASLLAGKTSPIRSTHQALADELGSVRVIVSRLLKNFADQGWLTLGREQIDVIDAAALKRFSEL